MTTISSATRSRPSRKRVRWLLNWPGAVVAYWKRREIIKTLQELNDHQLRDIGLRRDQIEAAVDGVADSGIARFPWVRGQR
jgi:uncharacterized protein YjiS (DUF1127 family)